MTTKLDRPLKRELVVRGTPYIVTIDALGLKLVQKGKRKGHELEWVALISGDAALARALAASLANAPNPPEKTVAKRNRPKL